MLWAIEGWRRLRKRGRFVQPGSAVELVNEMVALASPMTAFVDEHCTIGPGESVSVDDLYDAWCEWSQSNGWDRNGTKQRFGRDLRAVVHGLTDSKPTGPEGLRIRMYNGIGLNSKFE